MTMEEKATTTQEDNQLQLQQLFKVCDRKGKGYLIKSDLVDLCLSLGIPGNDAEAIFVDLDADSDGRISFVDFSSGFKEFLNPEGPESSQSRRDGLRRRASMWSIGSELKHEKLTASIDETNESVAMNSDDVLLKEQRRKESVYQAWTSLTSTLVDTNLLSISVESRSKIRQLHKELQCKTIPPNIASKVEGAFSSLVQEMEELQQQKKNLEERFEKEKSTHEMTLKSLEFEMEDQVAKMEERAIEKAKMDTEEQKRMLQEQMDEEVSQMQAHLKILQKVDSWLSKEQETDENRVQEIKTKLELAYQANRELKVNLTDATSNLALMRSELAQSRLQYDEKCKELKQEREQVMEYMHQYDHSRRQISLLHEANRRLKDTNDNLRECLEVSSWKSLPSSNYSSRASSINKRKKKNRSLSPAARLLPIPDTKYALNRLMNDLDTQEPNQDNERKSELRQEEDIDGLDSSEYIDIDIIDAPTSSERDIKSAPPLYKEDKVDQLTECSFTLVPSGVTVLDSHFVMPEFSPVQRRKFSDESAINEDAFLPAAERTFKVMMAGDVAVGKSSFIVRFCNGTFSTDIASTLGVDFKVKSMKVDGKYVVLQLWDTAGQERFRSVAKSYFRRADGILLLYDVTNEKSFLSVRHWAESINDACGNQMISKVLCGNKLDLREDFIRHGGTAVTPEQGQELAKECQAQFFETSSMTGENVIEALMSLSRNMMVLENVAINASKFKVSTPARSFNRCCHR